MTVREPVVTGLRLGAEAPPHAVAAAIARLVVPAESAVTPPAWLWPDQITPFRRTVAAIERHGGALLADPVGSGKSYIALAVARALTRARRTVCLAPATLVPQWRRLAEHLDIPLIVSSYERASRGTLPAVDGDVVILDESHRLRNPDTRRYDRIARWLVGHRALLLSATPLVNRAADLSHQLLLAIRDDALLEHGLPSLAQLTTTQRSHAALGEIIIARATAPGRPRRVGDTLTPTLSADEQALLDAIDRLTLSRHPPNAALIRGVLWRALASSPAALLAALRRYRRLLAHARDAAAAGHTLPRAELRRFIGDLDDQLVLWEMVGGSRAVGELALDDLTPLEAVIERAAAAAHQQDDKLQSLRRILADGRPTLVFTVARATARDLRDRLDTTRVAWCTGSDAGIGRTRCDRAAVLALFGPNGPNTAYGAAVLIATDVAAEGLNLQRAERVIHYDLPWTATRLEQREGRAARAGSRHATIDVIRFLPPDALERRIGISAALAAKADLPRALGLGARPAWSWRADLAEEFRALAATPGIAAIRSSIPGAVLGLALDREASRCSGGLVVGIDDRGHIRWDGDWILARLRECVTSTPTLLQPDDIRNAVRRLAPALRERLAAAAGARWLRPDPGDAARLVASRLIAAGRDATRRRASVELHEIELALRMVTEGRTVGEHRVLQEWATAPLATILRAIPRWRLTPHLPSGARLTLIAGLVFRLE